MLIVYFVWNEMIVGIDVNRSVIDVSRSVRGCHPAVIGATYIPALPILIWEARQLNSARVV